MIKMITNYPRLLNEILQASLNQMCRHLKSISDNVKSFKEKFGRPLQSYSTLEINQFRE